MAEIAVILQPIEECLPRLGIAQHRAFLASATLLLNPGRVFLRKINASVKVCLDR